MSVIEEINNLSIPLKIIAVNIFLIPFWYVAIYLFNFDFYSSADSVIIFAMCIVLSCTSTIPLSLMIYKAYEEVKQHKETVEYFFEMKLNAVVSLCIWLSLLIFVTYSLKFLFNFTFHFYYFIVLYFFPLFFFSFLYAVEKFFKRRSRNVE